MSVESAKFLFFCSFTSFHHPRSKEDTNLRNVFSFQDYGRNIMCYLHSNRLSLFASYLVSLVNPSGLRKKLSRGGRFFELFLGGGAFSSSAILTCRAFHKYYKDHILTTFILHPRPKNSKNRPKQNVFSWHFFMKNLTKKLNVFVARSHFRLYYFGAKSAFRKILRLVSQNWML